jgi:hypothetical protein
MKLIVFIGLLVSFWYGMRWIQNAGAALLRERETRRSGNPNAQRAVKRATDLVACPRCGSYIPAEFPSACARRDCPYPGIG